MVQLPITPLAPSLSGLVKWNAFYRTQRVLPTGMSVHSKIWSQPCFFWIREYSMQESSCHTCTWIFYFYFLVHLKFVCAFLCHRFLIYIHPQIPSAQLILSELQKSAPYYQDLGHVQTRSCGLVSIKLTCCSRPVELVKFAGSTTSVTKI